MAAAKRVAAGAALFWGDVPVAAFLRDQARKIIPEAFEERSVVEGV